VLQHALASLDAEPDIVAWLRPTSPLRLPEDVDGAIALLESTGARCVRSLCEVEHHPAWDYTLGPGGELVPLDPVADATILSRQLLPKVYRPNGAVEVIRGDALPSEGTLFGPPALGYVMPQERSIDIDGELDLAYAELLLRRRA
jgi:N-acylneuraminate cytidylyltransferase/CMP-N,N'-diacetyllegionaminic acid synthase